MFSSYPEFEPSGLGAEIFKSRHAYHEGESFHQACDRVAAAVAAAETDVVKYTSEFSELLRKNLFMPGGRIWYGAGRPKGQLMNCFVLGGELDSREGWGQIVSDMIVVCGTGGGLGVNFSPVRPRGSAITGQRGTSTGSVSLMEIVNSAGEVIKAGGGRRTALMFSLAVDHGDICEFLDKKLELSQLNNANVSVMFDNNPEDFFEKVRNDEDLPLRFGSRTVGSVPASVVWQKIINNALKSGEPGMLNSYLANKMSNIWYYKPLICTNPCGEQWLENSGACDLGAVVLSRFVHDGAVDWDGLKQAVRIGQRFLDNVITVNNYPLPKIRENCLAVRRIGLGVMGLHDMLLKVGLRYSSPEGLEFVDKVMRLIKHAAYQASIDVAKEKGSFPAFDADKFLRSGFAKTLKPSIRAGIKEHGIRNCALLTLAPTGTTSMVGGSSSSIEPMFAPAYIRKFREGDALKSEVVVHPLLKEFVEAGKDVSHFEGAHDLSVRDHFEMQRVCQRHVDSSISKTINLPQGTSPEELSALYMEFFPDLKGMTVYPEGSRENQPLTPIPLEDAIEAARLHSAVGMSETKCSSGSCDI